MKLEQTEEQKNRKEIKHNFVDKMFNLGDTERTDVEQAFSDNVVDIEFLEKIFNFAGLELNDKPQNEIEGDFRRTVFIKERIIHRMQKECKALALSYKHQVFQK